MKNNADIKKRNFLTQNEIESLLKAANTGAHAARNYCLTLLCFIHGFRASEICRLQISDITSIVLKKVFPLPILYSIKKYRH